MELRRVRYDGGLQTLQGGILSAPTGTSSASQKSWFSNSPSFVNTSRVFFGLERSRWILVEGCTSGRHFGSALQVNQLTARNPSNGWASLQVSSLSSSVLNLHPEGCFYHFGGYLHSADFASPSNLRIVPETLFNWGISHEKTGLSTFGMVGASF